MKPESRTHSILILLTGLFYTWIVYQGLQEVMAEAADSGTYLGGYSWQWLVVFSVIIFWGLLSLVVTLGCTLRKRNLPLNWYAVVRHIPRPVVWVIFIAGSLIIAFFMLAHRFSVHLQTPWLRWTIIIPWLGFSNFFLTQSGSHPAEAEESTSGVLKSCLLNTLIFFTIFTIFGRLARVTDYPFMLSWSEGNRFYDYSLIFGRSIYNPSGPMDTPYFSPGRYGLWGILFLYPGLSILVHRAWDAILWSFVPFLFSFAAGRRIQPTWLRWPIILWGGLFLMQGPTYPMILLAGTLVLLIQNGSTVKKALPVAVGTFYAAVSRWTWMLCGGYWAGLIELFETYPKRKGTWFQRILPTILIAAIGLTAGLVAYLLFFRNSATVDLPLNQPLLWYRLFPNSTYTPGILLGTFIASGPAFILVTGLAVTRKWKMDFIQALAVFGGLLGTWLAGIIISSKIGGGSNLHNMDMFLCSLVVVVALAARNAAKNIEKPNLFVNVLVILAVVAPLIYSVNNSKALQLAPQNEIDYAVDVLQKQVEAAKSRNEEILFIDQRQLVTFDVIPDVIFHPEYEKKVLMDMAMADNAAYFHEMYADIKSQRYGLIITEILNPRYVSQNGNFSEENNAWSKWVARPILCYYQVRVDLEKVGVEVLVPRQTPCTTPLPTH